MTEKMAVRTRQNVQRTGLHCNRNTWDYAPSPPISLCSSAPSNVAQLFKLRIKTKRKLENLRHLQPSVSDQLHEPKAR